MIKDLFDLAKIDRNTFVTNRVNVQLCFYLQDFYEKVFPAFKEKGIKLELICRENIFVRIGKVMRFEQVLLNLLNNALKYSEPDTKTSISVKEKGKVQIEIKDEGSGILKETCLYL